MSERGIDEQTLADLTQRKKKTLFDKRNFHFPNGSPKPLTFDHFSALYAVLKLVPNEFLLSKEEEADAFKQYKFLQRKQAKSKGGELSDDEALKRWNKNHHLRERWEKIHAHWPKRRIWEYMEHFHEHNRVENKKLQDTYTEVSNYYHNAKYRIDAHELLHKDDRRQPNGYRAYDNAQEIILNTVIETMDRHAKAGRSFKYRRTFYLRENEDIFPKNNVGECFNAFVAEASLVALRHIIKCSKLHPEFCKFRLVSRKASYRQFVMVDNEKMLIEDYGRYDQAVFPERVSVMDVTPVSRGEEMKDFLRECTNRYDYLNIKGNEIIENLEDALKFVQKQKKDRDEAIRLIRETPTLAGFSNRMKNFRAEYQTQIDQINRKISKLKEMEREAERNP